MIFIDFEVKLFSFFFRKKGFVSHPISPPSPPRKVYVTSAGSPSRALWAFCRMKHYKAELGKSKTHAPEGGPLCLLGLISVKNSLHANSVQCMWDHPMQPYLLQGRGSSLLNATLFPHFLYENAPPPPGCCSMKDVFFSFSLFLHFYFRFWCFPNFF